MRTKIIKIKGDWEEVVNDCRATVGKEALGKEPSREFKRNILISEHSPIRDISIKWMWDSIKTWVATHWVRHKWECFVKTQRPDRTGVERGGPDAPVTFTGDANAQALIDTLRKRLCYQASSETRQYAEDLKAAIKEVEPELSDVLVPNCIYRCGCPEKGISVEKCEWFDKMVKKHPDFASTDIQARYDAYNKFFYGE
ncbi:MAG: FAD-dependent thymidylate synthase [Bacteroidales bacterium]|nr:FAD-dependent thymidylate synthase [Bacteroidales bacterium]